MPLTAEKFCEQGEDDMQLGKKGDKLQIESCTLEKQFKRNIESMDGDVVLLTIHPVKDEALWKYYYLYRKNDPSLMIGINPYSYQLEYVEYVRPQRKIRRAREKREITYSEDGLRLFDEWFDQWHIYINFEKDFSLEYDGKDLLVFCEDDFTDVVGYRLASNAYVLVSNENIAGLILKDLSPDEIKILESAHAF